MYPQPPLEPSVNLLACFPHPPHPPAGSLGLWVSPCTTHAMPPTLSPHKSSPTPPPRPPSAPAQPPAGGSPQSASSGSGSCRPSTTRPTWSRAPTVSTCTMSTSSTTPPPRVSPRPCVLHTHLVAIQQTLAFTKICSLAWQHQRKACMTTPRVQGGVCTHALRCQIMAVCKAPKAPSKCHQRSRSAHSHQLNSRATHTLVLCCRNLQMAVRNIKSRGVRVMCYFEAVSVVRQHSALVRSTHGRTCALASQTVPKCRQLRAVALRMARLPPAFPASPDTQHYTLAHASCNVRCPAVVAGYVAKWQGEQPLPVPVPCKVQGQAGERTFSRTIYRVPLIHVQTPQTEVCV
jgi:hypothetical protein